MAALQNSELLAKKQALQNYAATVTEQTDEAPNQSESRLSMG